jgi:hypothetical protein
MADAFQTISGNKSKTTGGGDAFGAVSSTNTVKSSPSLGDRLRGAIQPFKQGLETASPVLEVLARPSQASLQALHPFSGTLRDGSVNPRTVAESAKGFVRGLTDISGKHDINLREAENVDRNVGGILGGVLDFVGSSAIDPSTYVGGGLLKTSKLGQTGVDALKNANEVHLATKLTSQGVKSLSPEELTRASDVLASTLGAKTASKILTQELAEPVGFKFAGKTVIPKTTLASGADRLGITAARDIVKASPIAQRTSELFNTGAALNRNLGEKATNTVATAARRADAERTTTVNNAVNKLRAAAAKVPEADAVVREELTPIIEHASQLSPQAADSHIKAAVKIFKESQRPQTAKLLQTLHDVNKVTSKTLTRAGVEDSSQNTLRKVITNDFKRAVRTNPAGVRQALGIESPISTEQLINTAHERLTTQFPGLTSNEINERLRPLLNGKNAVHENALGQVISRAGESAKQVAKVNLANTLAEATDDLGNSLLIKVPDFSKTPKITEAISDRIARMRSGEQTVATGVKNLLDKDAFEKEMSAKGFEKITTAAGDFYGPKEIKDYITNTDRILSNNAALAGLQKAVSAANGAFKNLTVNLPPFVLPFAARNMTDNLIQMWQGGMRDLRYVKTADNFVATVNKATKVGDTWQSALNKSNLDPKLKSWYAEAKRDGLVDESFLRSDLGGSGGVSLNTKDRVKKGLNVSDSDSWLTRHGSALNRRLEDTSRLALYMEQRSRGISPERAAETVREALFDYRDLTAFEKGLRSSAVPFYTYARKNIPLQIKTILNTPYKVIAPERLQSQISQGNDPTAPEYYQEQGLNKVGNVGGQSILGRVDTPLHGAEGVLSPLKYAALGDRQEAAQQFGANIGGVVQNTIGLQQQLATGKSAYSGQDVSKKSTLRQTAEEELPRYTSGESLLKGLKGTNAEKIAKLTALLSGAVVVAPKEQNQSAPTFLPGSRNGTR